VIYSLRGLRWILKDAAASSGDYQETIHYLTQLENVISDLSGSHYSSQDAELYTLSNAIKAQASELAKTVTDFSIKAQGYDQSLGASASNGLQHGIIPKFKWSMEFSKQDLSKFKAAVSERAMAIDLLHKSFTT
jgi:hypothetical protein